MLFRSFFSSSCTRLAIHEQHLKPSNFVARPYLLGLAGSALKGSSISLGQARLHVASPPLPPSKTMESWSPIVEIQLNLPSLPHPFSPTKIHQPAPSLTRPITSSSSFLLLLRQALPSHGSALQKLLSILASATRMASSPKWSPLPVLDDQEVDG